MQMAWTVVDCGLHQFARLSQEMGAFGFTVAYCGGDVDWFVLFLPCLLAAAVDVQHMLHLHAGSCVVTT